MLFEEFPKISRLNRDIVVTEKIDGTNAQIFITDEIVMEEADGYEPLAISSDNLFLIAGSRTRLISPTSDNYGFAGWVQRNANELFRLGPGRHFGEWWGKGVQRGYGQAEKRFSLFNVSRWNPDNIPSCVSVVPTLYVGPFDTDKIREVLSDLAQTGSKAAPGFMDPEGIVVFHTAGSNLFKVTLKNDEVPKGLVKKG